jgi:NAD(P)-dependent dehydrogenase (short-subunit alcohol dehydrogenase family)
VFNVNAKARCSSLKEWPSTSTHTAGRHHLVQYHGFPMERARIYAGSKATLKMYTEVASRELACAGITVNAVMPHHPHAHGEALPAELKAVVAETSPSNGWASPETLRTPRHAARPDAHWVTGQVILVTAAASSKRLVGQRISELLFQLVSLLCQS